VPVARASTDRESRPVYKDQRVDTQAKAPLFDERFGPRDNPLVAGN